MSIFKPGGIRRIGPDCPLTHWMLYNKRTMRWLCKKQFRWFGNNSEFRPGAYAVHTEHISVSDGVIIRPGTMLYADETWKISIGYKVLLGPGIHIYVNNHRFCEPMPIYEQGYTGGDVYIACCSWVGANSIILPGVRINPGAVIGAGSIVTKDIPAYEVWAGNPARKIGERGNAQG